MQQHCKPPGPDPPRASLDATSPAATAMPTMVRLQPLQVQHQPLLLLPQHLQGPRQPAQQQSQQLPHQLLTQLLPRPKSAKTPMLAPLRGLRSAQPLQSKLLRMRGWSRCVGYACVQAELCRLFRLQGHRGICSERRVSSSHQRPDIQCWALPVLSAFTWALCEAASSSTWAGLREAAFALRP